MALSFSTDMPAYGNSYTSRLPRNQGYFSVLEKRIVEG
jgi:hypothetical protein